MTMAVDEPIRTGTIEQPLQTAPNTSLTAEELQWGQYCHFAGVAGIIGTLICWMMKKETSPYLDKQGKLAVNFTLTNFIIAMICIITIIGIPVAFAVNLYSLIMSIMGGMKAKDGQFHKYPFSFNIIK
jgi:uncharacterized protein